MKKPKCKECGNVMNYYSSMMTFHCIQCQTHVKGIFAWNENEALEKYEELNKSIDK